MVGYDYFIPHLSMEVIIALGIMLLGIASIWWMESLASKADNNETESLI